MSVDQSCDLLSIGSPRWELQVPVQSLFLYGLFSYLSQIVTKQGRFHMTNSY